jgi:hypothetical protein
MPRMTGHFFIFLFLRRRNKRNMKFYPFFLLLLFLAACSGAPDQKTVQQVRENQPKTANPLENASTDYPQPLKSLGLDMPAKTTVIEAGKLSGAQITADVLSVKLLTSLSVQETYQYYMDKISRIEGITIDAERLVENADNPLRDFFTITASGENGISLVFSGNTAYGVPEKTEISINHAKPLNGQ